MVSSIRMLRIGILWLVTMAVLGYLAYIGGVWMKAINDFVMKFVFGDYIASQVGISWWFEPLYYVVIFLVAVAATWRIYQEVIAETDAYPELPPF